MFASLLCKVGRHSWEQHVNREVSGQGAVYLICRRCHDEKPEYGPPTPGQTIGSAVL